ncbi:hypothetical protein L218DRAFT_1006889 [Marasmius fiardii PR-910]|nr:hypothetical protein L218DRAFT_1006889 [Marasmius fiardii PR-910]
MLSFIPVEIIDYILGFCDKPTITFCSLVHKAWAPICQSRLFKRLTITAERIHKDIDRNTKINGLIEEIHFDFRSQLVSPLKPYQLRALTSLANKLKGKVNRMKRVQVYSDFYDVFSPNPNPDLNFSSSISSSFTGIFRLRIDTRNENILSLLRFACSFPSLEVLEIEGSSVSLKAA